MMIKQCGNCDFFIKGDELLTQGRCRRFPRQPVVKKYWWFGGVDIQWEFPLMDKKDVCGGWHQHPKYCNYCDHMRVDSKVYWVSDEKRICQECLSLQAKEEDDES